MVCTGTILSEVPVDVWVWGAVTLLMTAAIGFAAGCLYARMSVNWAVGRARNSLSKLFNMVCETLETAQEVCALLETFPNLLLSDEQTAQLDGKRNRLLETVARIVDGQQSAALAAAEQTSREHEKSEFLIEWLLSPEDDTTGLPDRSAFDANLNSLLESGLESGLLLIKVDKFAQLASRFDRPGANQLLRRMSRVVLRALRDEDLICHFSDETFGVLIPVVDRHTGRKLAETIRNTVRQHHFRLDDSGPEVLVTASFGYTTCEPADNADLVLCRAGDALAKSQRRGRNQLHLHDGSALVHCLQG